MEAGAEAENETLITLNEQPAETRTLSGPLLMSKYWWHAEEGRSQPTIKSSVKGNSTNSYNYIWCPPEFLCMYLDVSDSYMGFIIYIYIFHSPCRCTRPDQSVLEDRDVFRGTWSAEQQRLHHDDHVQSWAADSPNETLIYTRFLGLLGQKLLKPVQNIVTQVCSQVSGSCCMKKDV